MPRRITAMMVAVGLLAALPTPASAKEATVTVADFSFSPAKLTKPMGTNVTWRKDGGFHNVASTQGMFRSGDATSSAFTFTRTFSAGRFPYLCEVHGPSMAGTVRIRPKVRAKPAGAAFTVRWASAATNTGSRFTVRYRVADGRWRTWLKKTPAVSAVFGRNRTPIKVRRGVLYRFRVKSHTGGASSAFSPPKRYTP